MLILCVFSAVSAGSDYSNQLELIADNAELWQPDEVYSFWGYTVTDLDRNGRLEIISASLQGTGLYTTFRVYEVSEDGTALNEIIQDRAEYDSAPDIMTETAPAFADEENGLYYYVFSDFIRNGYAESYVYKQAVYLENETWKELLLASQSMLCSDPENCVTTYSDADGKEIDEQQYGSAEATYFPDCRKGTLQLNWNMVQQTDFARLTREDLVKSLENISVTELE